VKRFVRLFVWMVVVVVVVVMEEKEEFARLFDLNVIIK
jgi:hypothetical protein